MSNPAIDTDFLVVGAGPAGASLGCFLGQNGLKGIVISSSSGTADTPRAHLVNPFGLECLRDIGLEDDALRLSIRGEPIQTMRWCRSVAGQEYGRVQYWGGHPNCKRDTALASPCEWIDLPQIYMEPLLVRYATHHGFEVRFNTQLLDTKREGGYTLCTVKDDLSKLTYTIRSKALFGADGGRSTVARAFGFKFLTEPSFGVACNVLMDADLTHLMHGRQAQLTHLMKPDRVSRFAAAPILRIVRPWNKWLVCCFSPGVTEDPFKEVTPENPDLLAWLKEIIGDDTVEIKVERLDPWVVRESVAESYADNGNVFLLGDAAHRHPPAYGLGSNTCIQDAYNLAWKIAFVSKGLAGPGLLASYTVERQPVGAHLVKESNNDMRAHTKVWDALGIFATSPEDGLRQIKELEEHSAAGVARRARLHDALEGKRREGESLGLTMNQWYDSTAVYLDDEPSPRPELEGDPIVKILISTYPGTRLPHAWLDVPTKKKEISTQDLAGHGSFCLFTGHGGDAWRRAAADIFTATGIPIRAYGIGLGLDYIDVHRNWYYDRGIEDDGCVLVRPDRFVAWRAPKMVLNCEKKLLRVLNKILSRDELEVTS